MVALPQVGRAQAISEDLPLEIRIDLLREQLSNHLRNNDSQGIVDLIPQFRALDLELPDNLYFLEGRALFRLGRALEARDRLIIYLRNTGREGTYYQEAAELLLAVKEDADRQEKEKLEQERLRAEELARRSEKAYALRIREAQSYLGQVGFRLAEETGTLDKPTREALAVFQIRRDLPVSGDITDATLQRLRGEVPDTHSCDDLTRYPRKPTEFGIPISQIAFQAAVPACNDALRSYPEVIRFQVQYARALVSANRTDDAMVALDNALKLEYPEAETLVGWLHETGQLGGNGRPDTDSAQTWYERAALKNYPEAQLSLGRLLSASRDYASAANWYTRAAEQGYAPAEVELGRAYQAGRGVSRDQDRGLEWIKKAAEAGYPDGQYELGEIYERGRGAARDRTAAIYWYKKAADQGHADANLKLTRLGG